MAKPIVTAVDKGQVTVPEALLREIGLEAPLKAVAWRENGKIMMMVVPANSGGRVGRSLRGNGQTQHNDVRRGSHGTGSQTQEGRKGEENAGVTERKGAALAVFKYRN